VLDTEDAGGALEISRPNRSTFVIVVTRHLSVELARRWIAAVSPLLKPGVKFDVFLDWGEMSGYDSDARRDLTSWLMEKRHSITSARFLVKSRLVRMGVATANLASTLMGLPMQSDASDTAFDSALAANLNNAEPDSDAPASLRPRQKV
jgi:hypothetical protein